MIALSIVATATAAAHAQPALDEERAAELRRDARDRAHEGRLEDALALLRAASGITADPSVWIELAEAADRLRLDELALDAYETYLARRPDAPDHLEIAGRARVLREILAGHRYALAPTADAPTADAPTPGDVLVDWDGRPVVVRRTLAEWDGALRTSQPPRDLAPFPDDDRGLGRRLSAP